MKISQSPETLTLKDNNYLLIFVILILAILTAPIEILISIFLFVIEILILIGGISITSHFDKKTGKGSVRKTWLFGKRSEEFSLIDVSNLETKTLWNLQIVGPKPHYLVLHLKHNLPIQIDYPNYSSNAQHKYGKAIAEFLGINYS